MNSHSEPPVADMDVDLLAQGKVIRLGTTGRTSGRSRHVIIGLVETPTGDLLVAAGDESVHWALNLSADPRCVVESTSGTRPYRASPLEGAERAAAITALILKYGTPAERLGGGPAFRLVPRAEP